ncbi:MAG: glycosyltransferase family 39 protein [Candidatus Paceibacterota bacterium]|jgi:hypothetical protein
MTLREQTKSRLLVALLAIAVLLPRIGLLGNGLDAQRIWDTNTPAAFHFLQAAADHRLPAFLAADQKYPLLGSYLYAPVVGAYYAAGRIFGMFASSDAFLDSFALGETHLFFWLRLEMLLAHLAALYGLYRLTKRYTNQSARAGLYAAVFASADFYAAMFSVEPRIHSWAFAAGVFALYASFRLLEEKSLRNYLLAFGAAGAAASISQSGFPALILPILAHSITLSSGTVSFRHHMKAFGYAAAVFAAIVLVVGYPRFFPALAHPGDVLSVFLSGEHSQPSFSIRGGLRFARDYAFGSSFALVFALLAGLWFRFAAKRREQIRFAAYDWLAAAHIAAFALVFGFSNVMSGRFMLAILPSAFFLAGRIVLSLEKRRGFVYAVAVLLALQAYGIGILSMIAWTGDTRAETTAYLLAHTNEDDIILSTVDTELLGVTPAPHSVSADDAGAAAQRIRERDLVGSKTRQIRIWRPEESAITDANISNYRYIAVSSADPYRYRAEELLARNGYRIAAQFAATRKPDILFKSFIAWDMIAPVPHMPYPFRLRAFRAFGPTMTVYEHP